jgi:hypothetical protein
VSGQSVSRNAPPAFRHRVGSLSTSNATSRVGTVKTVGAVQDLSRQLRAAHLNTTISAVKRRSLSYPKTKPSLVVEWTLSCADRRTSRRTIAEKWSDEDPYTNYRYNVERTVNGKRVYLLRPTWLNKGFDFQVNVEGLVKVVKVAKGATREMPSHGDVMHDLRSKLAKRPKDGAVLFDAVCAVYDCGEPANIVKKMPGLSGFKEGWPIDQLLYIIKWLMIEQDVTYWLQTGRDMLMSGIETEIFKLPAR